MTITFAVLVILLLTSCKDFNGEEISLSNSTFREELIPWNDLLNQLDLESTFDGKYYIEEHIRQQ